MAQSVLEMAKELVMALIQAGHMPPEDMQMALQRTYAGLAELKAGEEAGISLAPPGDAHEPVNWKKSMTKHTVTCLECGASFKQLSVRHLKDHDMDARAYRLKYGIPRTQPLSAKDTTALRKKIVQKSRPWEKAPTYLKAQEKMAEAAAPAKKGRAKGVRKQAAKA